MKEQDRIIKLFKDLYDGSPWIDVNIMDTISGLSASEAAQKIYPEYNTVWEIVNHMINWRLNVLERVNGNIPASPDDNYFSKIKDSAESAWKETLKKFNNTNSKWISHVSKINEAEFDLKYPQNKMTYYEHIHGVLQHDAYHLGQLTLLIKSIRKGKK